MTRDLTRRGLLLGVGAGMLAACGEGEASIPDAPRFARGRFASTAMNGAQVGWTLAYPKGHEGENLPIVVSLHGRGATHRTTFTTLRMAQTLDRVVVDGTEPFAIASVDGGDHSYWHQRVDGTDAGAMVRDEFVPLLERRGLDTGRLGLYGWSMGGYGAMLLAGREKLPVKGVAVSSPALFTSAGASSPGAYDNAEDYAENDVYGHSEWLDGVKLRVDCGRGDPFYAATRDFVGRLRSHPAGGFIDGKHEPSYWRKVAPAQLRFLGEQLRD